MKKLSLLGCALFLASATFAQKDIKDFYAKTVTAGHLKRHLSIIASDSLEGRETGKAGQRMAAEYIENFFKEIGLQGGVDSNTYQQEFAIDMISPSEVSLKVEEKTYSFPDDILYLGNVATQSVSFREVVFAGYGIVDSILDNYANADVSGKVVLILSGEPKKEDGNFVLSGSKKASQWSLNPSKKIELARSKGAKAIIEFNPNLSSIAARYARYLMRTRVSLSDEGLEYKAPYIMVSDSIVNNWLLRTSAAELETTKYGTVLATERTKLDYKSNAKKGSSTNVIGVLPGTSKADEYLVITAHYDHLGKTEDEVFNGADDDGSGTVTVLELAEAFQQAAYEGYRPKRSIIFMLVSGEEKGLLGSEYYTNHPLFPLENTITNLNIDMVGRVDNQHKNNPNYVYVIGSEMLSKDLRKISEKANKKTVNLDLDYTYDDPEDPNRFYYRSDHYNFAKNNIPVIFYFNGTHADYHKSTDTVEKINFDKMEKIGQLVFYTAWELANRDAKPRLNASK